MLAFQLNLMAMFTLGAEVHILVSKLLLPNMDYPIRTSWAILILKAPTSSQKNNHERSELRDRRRLQAHESSHGPIFGFKVFW